MARKKIDATEVLVDMIRVLSGEINWVRSGDYFVSGDNYNGNIEISKEAARALIDAFAKLPDKVAVVGTV
jgi:hypothetical protein